MSDTYLPSVPALSVITNSSRSAQRSPDVDLSNELRRTPVGAGCGGSGRGGERAGEDGEDGEEERTGRGPAARLDRHSAGTAGRFHKQRRWGSGGRQHPGCCCCCCCGGGGGDLTSTDRLRRKLEDRTATTPRAGADRIRIRSAPQIILPAGTAGSGDIGQDG